MTNALAALLKLAVPTAALSNKPLALTNCLLKLLIETGKTLFCSLACLLNSVISFVAPLNSLRRAINLLEFL